MLKLAPAFALFSLLAVGQLLAQNAKFEWFVEGGASSLNLGSQSGPLPPLFASLSLPDTAFTLHRHSSVGGLFFSGVRYRFTPQNAAEANFSYGFRSFVARGTTTGAPLVSGFETTNVSFNYVRYLPRTARLGPFVTAGLGVTTSNSALGGIAQHNLAGNLGFGTDIRVNERLAVRVEARDYIARRPGLLRGTSHTWQGSTGLVVVLRDSPAAREAFPRFELVAELGASFLTSGSAPSQAVAITLPNGQMQNAVLTMASSFSKAGRILGGARVRITEKNAVEFSWAYSPNRYQLVGTLNPPVVTVVPNQVTQWFNNWPINYVRYLPNRAAFQPFLTAGLGIARYAGIERDINALSWNLGAGIDIPVKRRIALRVEFRDAIVGQPEPIRGVTHNLTPTAGVVFKFY